MPGIDFDGLTNASVIKVLGDAVVQYTPRGGAPFELTVVFDKAWQTVEGSGRHGISLPVSSTKPMFGCRKADFPAGIEPQQHDCCVIAGETYTVADVQPDGVSNWFFVTLN